MCKTKMLFTSHSALNYLINIQIKITNFQLKKRIYVAYMKSIKIVILKI